jgi:hypothetical protein
MEARWQRPCFTWEARGYGSPPPLARLIAAAAERSQIIVVSHAAGLVSALDREADCRQIVLEKQLSETIVQDQAPPAWAWPSR